MFTNETPETGSRSGEFPADAPAFAGTPMGADVQPDATCSSARRKGQRAVSSTYWWSWGTWLAITAARRSPCSRRSTPLRRSPEGPSGGPESCWRRSWPERRCPRRCCGQRSPVGSVGVVTLAFTLAWSVMVLLSWRGQRRRAHHPLLGRSRRPGSQTPAGGVSARSQSLFRVPSSVPEGLYLAAACGRRLLLVDPGVDRHGLTQAVVPHESVMPHEPVVPHESVVPT